MRAAFGIAIGISAIDALLSAFTAVTVLALVIVSQAPDEGGALAKDKTILQIEKSAPVRLLLDIQGSQNAAPILQLASSPYSVLKADKAPHLFTDDRGQVSWADPPCAKESCPSVVTIVSPKSNWSMRLRIAGIVSESAPLPADLHVTIRKLGKNRCKISEGSLSVDRQIIFSPEFSANDGVGCL